jgi:RimJ/RimL family protein N-acetyltransferase
MGVMIYPPYQAIGFVDDEGTARGAVVFYDFSPRNVEIAVAGLWTKQVFRVLGHHCFNVLKVERVTARTRNPKVARVIEAAGFRREGTARSYYPGGQDALLFGMLRAECKWFDSLPSNRD